MLDEGTDLTPVEFNSGQRLVANAMTSFAKPANNDTGVIYSLHPLVII